MIRNTHNRGFKASVRYYLSSKDSLSCLYILRNCGESLACSEEVGLLHDSHELLLADLVVAIAVGLVDHLLDLLVSHVLTKLLSNTLQVLEGNLARLVVVEEAESLEHLFTGVSLGHLDGHHVEEVAEVDDSTLSFVGIGDHFLDLLLLCLLYTSDAADE